MSDFSVEWLDLREPADVSARAPELIEQLVATASAQDVQSGKFPTSQFA